MAPPTQKSSKHLSPLNTSWHNRSTSSISATSEAATFHSAYAHSDTSKNMELRPLSQPQLQTQTQSQHPFILSMTKPLPSPKLDAVKMSRQDSGYSDSSQVTDRRSISSARQIKRKTTASSGTSSRPSTKRASKSSVVRTSTSNTRPSMQLRHTIPGATPYTQAQQTYEFFQFPTFPSTEPETLTTPPPPPPATVQYWTSDSTRRLEYAAIDAASNGVRGFFLKLVPDCIVPKENRRTRFCNEGDEGSDAGSVRRYRLHLPEEKPCRARRDTEGTSKRPNGFFRRWSSFGKVRRD